MSACPLPTWVQWLQALAVPVIALVGTWIALQQMHLAAVKLRHDLYERRFKVFDATRALLSATLTQGYPTKDQLNSYEIATADAVFLLNDDVSKYLSDIRRRARSLSRSESPLAQMNVGDQTARPQKSRDDFAWLTDCLGTLVEKFKPFLSLREQRSFLPRLLEYKNTVLRYFTWDRNV
jgi:hypothetical protein